MTKEGYPVPVATFSFLQHCACLLSVPATMRCLTHTSMLMTKGILDESNVPPS